MGKLETVSPENVTYFGKTAEIPKITKQRESTYLRCFFMFS